MSGYKKGTSCRDLVPVQPRPLTTYARSDIAARHLASKAQSGSTELGKVYEIFEAASAYALSLVILEDIDEVGAGDPTACGPL